MARLAGVDIPNDKRVVISLTYIHGLGRTTSEKLVKMANVNPDARVKELSDEEIGRLRQLIDRLSADKEIVIEGDLRREVALNIKRLQEIGTYRGQRHRRGLPTRGQRTRTNGGARSGRSPAGRRRASRGESEPWASRRRRPHGPGAASVRTSRSARRTSRAPSTTRSSRSPTCRATSSPGVRRARRTSRAAASR